MQCVHDPYTCKKNKQNKTQLHRVIWIHGVFVVCERPEIWHSIVHGSGLADDVDTRRNFTAGSRLEVVCETGYRFPHTKSTVLHIVCHVNGSWTDLLGSETIPSCQCEYVNFYKPVSLQYLYCNNRIVWFSVCVMSAKRDTQGTIAQGVIVRPRLHLHTIHRCTIISFHWCMSIGCHDEPVHIRARKCAKLPKLDSFYVFMFILCYSVF